MARTSAPHSATAQFFINAADNEFLELQVGDAAGLGLRRVRQGRRGHRGRRRDRAGAHRQPRRPRRRAARRRDDHARDRRLLSRRAAWPRAARRRAAGAAPARGDADLRRAGALARDRLHPRPAPRREHAARLRRLGGAPAAHPRRRGLHPRRPVRGLGRRRHGRARLRGALRRGAERRGRRADGRLHGRQPRLPGRRRDARGARRRCACATRRCSSPSAQRVLLSHGDALCLDDVAYQRYRAHRPPARACSARSWRLPLPVRGARSAARLRRRSERREPARARRLRRRRRRRGARLAARRRRRRRWSTATPTRRPATRSRPAPSATC